MRNIKLQSRGIGLSKPKDYTKNGSICSVTCIILDTAGNILDRNQKIVYEVKPNLNRLIYSDSRRTNFSSIKKNKRSIAYWGEVKQILELPPILDKLSDEDFAANTGYFKRDNVQMPFVTSIEIKNGEKYKILKIKEERKNKLDKIASNED